MIVLTGATSFLGSALLAQLLARVDDVVGSVCSPPNGGAHAREQQLRPARMSRANPRDLPCCTYRHEVSC